MANFLFSSLVICLLIKSYVCGTFMNPIKIVHLRSWNVETSDGKVKDATVETPTGIYTFGEKLKLIDNVLQDTNDDATKWIAKKQWNFTTEFSGDDLYKRNNIHLVFDGVDAVAEVKLNNVLLGKMENMFRQYVFDIKKHVKEGSNKLVVSFKPPIDAAAAAFDEQKREFPPKCPPATVKGDCHINMLRKTQTSFGSTFGPSVPSVGFWKPVRIEGFQESVLREVLTQVEDLNKTFWRLHIDCYLANNSQNHIKGRMDMSFDKIPHGVFIIDLVPNFYGEMVWSTFIDFNKTEVKTWWPVGYGSQKLYNLTVSYYSSNIVERTPKVKMIGFRSIELVQDDNGNGCEFYFLVNNVKIFAKGSNLVPLSIFPEEIENSKTLKRIIQDAYDSNMNMLRVWGGGTYLPNKFYDFADRKGILIWQDFMFTSAFYPSNEEFLKNVRAEVNYQLKRIYSHPSLALFSANFEIEQAYASNWYNVSKRRDYYDDYQQLFVKTIKNEFDRLTNKSKNFVFSSPSNGIRTDNEHYLSSNPNSEFYGDVHYLKQTGNPFNVSKYPIPRFVSAYGVQSLPSAESLLKQAKSKESSNLQTSNGFLTHRQHMSPNFDQMSRHVGYLLDMPPRNAIGVDRTFIFYSQIVQAYSLKLQTEYYRTFKSYVRADGRGTTMGALYWHMNDVWSAPSLSGIDYYGKWKMAQYAIKDAFAQVIITGTIIDDTLKVFVISDRTDTKYDVTAKVQIYSWDSFTPVFATAVPCILTSLTSHQIHTASVNATFQKLNCTVDSCFFYLKLEKAGTPLAPDNYILPNNLRSKNISYHTIEITSVTQLPYQNIYEIQIEAKFVSAFVWLDSHDLEGKFSENGFFMVRPQKSIYFFPKKQVKLEEVLKSIDVIHSHDPVISGSVSIQNIAQYFISFVVLFQIMNIILL